MNHLQQAPRPFRHDSEEALAMLENGRPMPGRRKHVLISALIHDWTEQFSHFGPGTIPPEFPFGTPAPCNED